MAATARESLSRRRSFVEIYDVFAAYKPYLRQEIDVVLAINVGGCGLAAATARIVYTAGAKRADINTAQCGDSLFVAHAPLTSICWGFVALHAGQLAVYNKSAQESK